MEILRNNKVLLDAIERENAETDYFCVGTDKVFLQSMLDEISSLAGKKYQYLAELDVVTIPGAGEIIASYIHKFSAESIKGYLLHHLVSDRVKDCDNLILDMYIQFKASDEYIPGPGRPASAHIYARYDNAIRRLRPKRLKNNLTQLAYHPRDFFYLPLTMRMLSAWRIPEIKDILVQYSREMNISEQEIGLEDDVEAYFPPFSFIKREIRFTAIEGLKYFPSTEVAEMLQKYATDVDLDIRTAAKTTLRTFKKNWNGK